MMSEVDKLRFGKQFFIVQSTISNPEFSSWNPLKLDDRFSLYTHPALRVTSYAAQDGRFIGLGHFLDPRNAQAADFQILQGLGEKVSDFAELESLLDRLGGRWVLIATLSGETRIYHDAAGLKSVFFCGTPAAGMSIASQPALLEMIGATEPDVRLRQEYEQYAPRASWPVHAIPYFGVKQLLPNHALDLQVGDAVRYWPKEQIEPSSIEVVSKSMAGMLTSMIESATNRRECVMSLTGGYDTRLLLACAHTMFEKIEFFTIHSAYTKDYDITIPRKIARDKKLRYSVLYDDPDDPYREILIANVGGMFYGQAISKAKTLLEYVRERFHLTGITSELNRCYYYKNGKHPNAITASELSRRAGFSGNPVAEQGINKWLDEAPLNFNVNLLDLFYWEHRLGVWGSCGFAFREAAMDQIPPMNCREFIQLGLSVEAKSRTKPYALIRSIIERTDPELLNYPFNHSWRDVVTQTLLLPRRAMKSLKARRS